jgi:cystinosin
MTQHYFQQSEVFPRRLIEVGLSRFDIILSRFLTRNVRQWWLGSLAGGVVFGLLLGCVRPTYDRVLPEGTTPRSVLLLSSVTGWTYFICWSVSFWPQVLLNYRRKAVDGLAVDFLVLNTTGFAAYTAYNLLLYFPTATRDMYIERHGEPPGVHGNDVFFCVHALVLTTVSLAQVAMYAEGQLRVLPATAVFCASSVVSALMSLALCPFLLLDLLSVVKILTTVVKYVPQIMENHRRRSTTGFSFSQVILDATGSVLSASQLFLDALVLHSWRIIRGNPAKLLLGTVSMLYDGALTCQHITYKSQDIDEPLL